MRHLPKDGDYVLIFNVPKANSGEGYKLKKHFHNFIVHKVLYVSMKMKVVAEHWESPAASL